MCMKLCFLTLHVKRVIHILQEHSELIGAQNTDDDAYDLRRAAPT